MGSNEMEVTGGAGSAEVAVPVDGVEGEQIAAERSLIYAGIVGGCIGMAIGAVLWALLVVVALALADTGFPVPWWMGAVVGVFAGSFLGSWAGIMARVDRLEAAEHACATAMHQA